MLNKKAKMLAIELIMIMCLLTLLPSLARSTVTIGVGYGTGLPGSSDNPVAISLENQERAKGFQADICDEDDYLTCTACETTGRSADYACVYNELPNGCFRAILVDISGSKFIEAGDGPILTIKCDVSEIAPLSECRDLNAENVNIPDELGISLPPEDSIIDNGLFCFCDNCEPPVVLIELISFSATPRSGKVILAWSTESEIDNAGFNVYRAESEDGEYTLINEALIQAEGSPTEGATYELIDEDVRNRKTYYYMLEDIDLNGVSTIHDTVGAKPRLIHGFGK